MSRFGLCRHLVGKAPLQSMEMQSGAQRFIPRSRVKFITHQAPSVQQGKLTNNAKRFLGNQLRYRCPRLVDYPQSQKGYNYFFKFKVFICNLYT